MTTVGIPWHGDHVALSLHPPTGEKVGVDVDDVTIVLALLHLLTQDVPADSPILGVSDRVSARLRADMATLQPTMAAITRMRRPPSA